MSYKNPYFAAQPSSIYKSVYKSVPDLYRVESGKVASVAGEA